MSRKKPASRPASRRSHGPSGGVLLRIVGGRFRGSQISYDGELRTRPMKDRVREAVFNLVGPAVKNKRVIDLFAGTGAMGLEAVSRGATHVVAVERSFPACKMIQQNATSLGVADIFQVCRTDVFHWWDQGAADVEGEWLVFCCPPYAFFTDRVDEMLQLTAGLLDRSPSGSLIVLEFDRHFDAERLPDRGGWDVRTYAPAVVAIYEKRSSDGE